MKHLQAILLLLLFCRASFSQTLHNAKNVDRTAMSFFDGQKTFRALEHTVNNDPASDKIYRLQTLPENGYPEIILKGVDNGTEVFFEDQTPFDNLFDNNQTPHLSSEAVQTFYGFQEVMKAFGQRFGWKGIDGTGTLPIKIFMKDGEDEPFPVPNNAGFVEDTSNEHFIFFRSLSQPGSFNNVLEIIGHEFTHAVLLHKTGVVYSDDLTCSEFNTLHEGIADIFGIYLENRIEKSDPQNFNWLFSEQFKAAEDFSSPKNHQFADTYNGQFYVNVCSDYYNPHPGAGVAEKWFVLLSDGFQGSAYNDLGYGYSNLSGIGPEKAIQIVWEALASLKAYSDYPALKAFTLKAAEKLYGLHSTEYLAVQNAWCAVGVCDNNSVSFTMYPANGAVSINPWPTTKINLTWQNALATKWRVQTSTKFDFSENLQEVDTDNTTMVIDPNGLLTYSASVDAYYHPGEKVYARAQIIEADPNFCKGLNPLCAYYQQFGPAHAFTLKDQKVEFWPGNSLPQVVNPWNKPKFIWKSVPGSDRYRIQVATDNAFKGIIYDEVVLHTGNFTEKGEINTILEAGHDYYLRIRAERLDFVKINKNYGAWSDVIQVHGATPQTSITQALNQGPNDPPKVIPSLGCWITWYAYSGATSYVVQVAKDPSFTDVIRSETAAANITTIEFAIPQVPDKTELFFRVLPQKGSAVGLCNNTFSVITNESATIPKMKSPTDGSNFPFKNFLAVFSWNGGTLSMPIVDHFELFVTENTFGLTTILATKGKDLDLAVLDEFLFDDKLGVTVSVRGVGPFGAKSALSAPFHYNICADHPVVLFPGDQTGVVDAMQDFNIDWNDSFFDPITEYRVTLKDATTGIAMPGFSDKPTTATSMLVPAGTLTNGKKYAVSVKNAFSCAGILLPVNVFSAASSGSNQPQPPKLVNFTIGFNGFRNDPDGSVFPPEYGTSNFVLGFKLIDPDENPLELVDPNGNIVTELDVDSENSGIIMHASNKPQGTYKLRVTMKDITDPLLYYPFDQPRFSVFLNGQPEINPHVITVDFVNPASAFNEWQVGFQFADIILDIK
ncbi:Thermolysin metallopeptidase, alpha-helical domain [Dyadobacter soli]|uniref:Thermolysin metallopeptidase, alpha-helical domain n=1 Tax=Dyadobacter soli TaxID=659014 RepID=A0A1G7NFR3_9BACT|nr:M4 family metallopeptidase [Dyadobacter soli]SDF72806.1 Thermolysin metallopeptidase, alpha-helical domain [Dyadobacter soli]